MLPPNVLPQIAGRAAGLLAMRAWPVAVDAAAILARKAEVEAAMAKGRGRCMSFSAVEQGETDFAAPAHNAFRSCQSNLHRERRVMRFQ